MVYFIQFEDSIMVGGEDEDEDSEQQSGQYKDTMARSSNTGWVYDEEDEIIEALSKRVGAILNLDHRAAEAYQVRQKQHSQVLL